MPGDDLNGQLGSFGGSQQCADDHHVRPFAATRYQGALRATCEGRVVSVFHENDGECLRHGLQSVNNEDSKVPGSMVHGMLSWAFECWPLNDDIVILTCSCGCSGSG